MKAQLILIISLFSLVLLVGCTSPQSDTTMVNTPVVSSPTIQVTATLTPVTTKNLQKDNDIKFLSETAKLSDEMAIASKIFNNAVSEQEKWLSNVELRELEYQEAVEYLASEQAIADSITSRYAANMQNVGSDVARARSLTIQYNQDIAEVNTYVAMAQEEVTEKDAARTTAKKPLDLKAKGLDIDVLNATCSKVTEQLTPMPVSSDLQPMKDQYLTAISSFKQASDMFVIAVNYYNTGKISEGSNALKQTSTYIEAGNNQLDACSLKLQQYKNKLDV